MTIESNDIVEVLIVKGIPEGYTLVPTNLTPMMRIVIDTDIVTGESAEQLWKDALAQASTNILSDRSPTLSKKQQKRK